MIDEALPALRRSPRDRETELNVTATFEDLPDGVLVVNREGLVQATNGAFLQLVACDRREVVEQPLTNAVAEQDVLQIVGFEGVFGAESTRDTPVLFRLGGGGCRSLLVNSARIVGSGITVLTLRAADSFHQELSDTTRWAASEQDRADELGRARDELAAKNSALRVAQEEVEVAYRQLKDEAATRERLENDLRLAQKLEAVGQLAAGVAHEINTPMQYIGDNMTFLARAFQRLGEYLETVNSAVDDASTSDVVRERVAAMAKKVRLEFLLEQAPKALSSCQEGVSHVSDIVRAMKSFARVDQGEKSQADLNQALRDTLIVAQNEYKNVATVDVDLGELPPVDCFVGRLNQVFSNLIINAAHAIADAPHQGLGKIRVSSRAVGDSVEIKIADNGGGIPPAIRHRIFEQFFTTKAVGRGTGQGLSIAHNIVVEVHGGTLDFESEVDAGTAFTIRLPVDGQTKLTPVAK
jgi:signal transduction histidine kinase